MTNIQKGKISLQQVPKITIRMRLSFEEKLMLVEYLLHTQDNEILRHLSSGLKTAEYPLLYLFIGFMLEY